MIPVTHHPTNHHTPPHPHTERGQPVTPETITTPTPSNTVSVRRTHTFAVNNLRSWFARGQDVGALLPVLQTYMGHSSLADTAYYLHQHSGIAAGGRETAGREVSTAVARWSDTPV